MARIWQYETHRQLAGRARPGAWRSPGKPLDAIVVPASREASNLDHAVTLARAMRCWLVVFCSHETIAADVAKLLADRCFTQAVVVEMPQERAHPLLDFRTSDWVIDHGVGSPNGDLSAKRNMGLLLARMAGWDRIFFMDDDIRDLAAADLHVTVAMLDRYRSAGMRVDSFPDNSVVCHARRDLGDEQDVFVTGSVLAVNCAQQFSFFPEIYNEDWLFFYDDAQSGRLGNSYRHATQLKYDPFANEDRAKRQEFGDLLAEGLYALLHNGRGFEYASKGFWKGFIDARWSLLDNLKQRAKSGEYPDGAGIINALDGAVSCLIEIQPEACEEYIHTWRADLAEWRQEVQKLPVLQSIDEALVALGCQNAVYDDSVRAHPPSCHDSKSRVRPGRALIPPVTVPALLLGAGLSTHDHDGIRAGRSRRQKV